jgi:hypothetical protein
MPELDLAKLAEGRKALEAWQAPDAFVAKVDEIADAVDSEALFNRNEVQFLRDAMVLATFMQYRTTEKVRLADEKDPWPDGFIGSPQAIHRLPSSEGPPPGTTQ